MSTKNSGKDRELVISPWWAQGREIRGAVTHDEGNLELQ